MLHFEILYLCHASSVCLGPVAAVLTVVKWFEPSTYLQRMSGQGSVAYALALELCSLSVRSPILSREVSEVGISEEDRQVDTLINLAKH